MMVCNHEYRSCLVDNEKALFHRWVDDDKILLAFDIDMRQDILSDICKTYVESGVIPNKAHVHITRKTFGIVEFEDGLIKKSIPKQYDFWIVEDYSGSIVLTLETDRRKKMNSSELEDALAAVRKTFVDFGVCAEEMARSIGKAFIELGDSLSELNDMFNHVYNGIIKEKPVKPKIYGMSLIPNAFHDPREYYHFTPQMMRHLPYQRRNY